MTFSFHETASETHLKDGHILVAKLQDGSGNENWSEIDLNDFIGNDNGHFKWAGTGFSLNDSAVDIRFGFEGADNQPILRAKLRDVDGNLHDRDINLAENVENVFGTFKSKFF
ncbi:Cyanovirin-N [Peziza echinospora]|nr:Cyanovirin-N [Peziza echinospora]